MQRKNILIEQSCSGLGCRHIEHFLIAFARTKHSPSSLAINNFMPQTLPLINKAANGKGSLDTSDAIAHSQTLSHMA